MRDEVKREYEMDQTDSLFRSSSLPIRPLTARQLHAINLLAMGKTVVNVDKTLDVGVSTLHRWKATHPLFRAELTQRQHNLFDTMITKLRLTMSRAVDQLFEMMTGDSRVDRREVMREMLKLLRPQRYLVPEEPMSAEAVLDECVREMRASRGDVVGTEITEEERLAAIPEEWRAESHTIENGQSECPAPGMPVPRTKARVNEYIAPGHPEPSGKTPPEPEASTSLTSRECGRRSLNRGLEEGAVEEKIDGVDERADEGDRRDAERLRVERPDAPLSPANSPASRPLPQPFPQGEGSKSIPTPGTQRATHSIPIPPLPPRSDIG